jgi:hypothetical protein
MRARALSITSKSEASLGRRKVHLSVRNAYHVNALRQAFEQERDGTAHTSPP